MDFRISCLITTLITFLWTTFVLVFMISRQKKTFLHISIKKDFEFNSFDKKIRKSVFNYSSIQKALILIGLITSYDYDMFAIVGVQLNKNTVQYLNCFVYQ